MIRLTTKLITQVNSSSGTYVIPFETDKQVQAIEFATGDAGEITNQTQLRLVQVKRGTEYPYEYNLLYNHPANRSLNGSLKLYAWTLWVYYGDDDEGLNGSFVQLGNKLASSITNIQIFDPDGVLLEKDMFNLWVVPNMWPAGSVFKITYDTVYPTNSSVWPNVNEGTYNYDPSKGFIAGAGTRSKTEGSFELTDVISPEAGIDYIQFDFDDNDGIGVAMTYVMLTRDNIKPARLYSNPNSFKDISWQGDTVTSELSLTNIDMSMLSTNSDKTWIHPDLDNIAKTVSITVDRNEAGAARSGSVSVYGSNTDGVYASTTISITQAPKESPYVGGANETTQDYSGDILPVIHTDYKGNIIDGTNTFTIFNALTATGEDLIDGISFYDEETRLKINFVLNVIPGTRNLEITINDNLNYNYRTEQVRNHIFIELDTSSYGIIRQNMMIIQDASPEHIVSPIWKDIYFESPKSYFRFRNIDTGELLYNGVIYPSASNKIKVNEILSDYIFFNKYPFDNENDFVNNNTMVEAVLEIADNGKFEYYDEAKIYHLYWNYSYDYRQPNDLLGGYSPGYECYHAGIDIETNFYNPIQYYDPRQLIFVSTAQGFSEYNKTGIQVVGINTDTGSENICSLPTNSIKGDVVTAVIRPNDYDRIILHKDSEPDEDFDHDYTWYCGYAKCTKANYAVYYLNSSGLWSWMLFEGKQVENLKTNVNKFLTDNSNSVSYNIHNGVYNNTVEESYNLTSVYLQDEQSKMLKDLYTSPLIYVHELENNVIYNVYLGTNTYDIKTYHNQGRKRYTHNIKLIKSINKNINV